MVAVTSLVPSAGSRLWLVDDDDDDAGELELEPEVRVRLLV